MRVLGRTGLRYTEGDHSVEVDSEMLDTPRGIVVYAPSARVWEGPETRPVSEAERERLVSNVKRAFAAWDYDLELLGPFDWDSVAVLRPRNDE